MRIKFKSPQVGNMITFKKVFFAVNIVLLLAIVLVNRVKCQQHTEAAIQDSTNTTKINQRLLVVATTEQNLDTEVFLRFNRSIEAFGLELIVLKFENRQAAQDESRLSELESTRNKFELLRTALAAHKNQSDLVILLLPLDKVSVIVNGNKRDILNRFNNIGSEQRRIVFAADKHSLIESSSLLQKAAAGTTLSDTIAATFISARAIIGHAEALWDLVKPSDENENRLIKANYDLQLYATYVYLDETKRRELQIEVDQKSEIFQRVYRNDDENLDLKLEFDPENVRLKNLAYQTEPVVVFANKTGQTFLNSLGNYLGRAWTERLGCWHCNGSMISLATTKDSNLPSVLVGIFVEEPTPFLGNFFDDFEKLNYPKSKMHLFVHNAVEYHEKQVDEFMDKIGSTYASKQLVQNSKPAAQQRPMLEWQARAYALDLCNQLSCDYFLSLDSISRLDFVDSLKVLIETNKTIVAPLLSRPKKLWSNFWGAITDEGYYSRSFDYVELVSGDRLGVWNVPHLMNAYLIEGKFLRINLKNNEDSLTRLGKPKLTYYDPKYPFAKPALIFTRNLRQANVWQFVTNLHEFGYLVDTTSYNTSLKNADLYELENNVIDWEQTYLHENYSNLLEDTHSKLESPCQDVYWFPLVSEKFNTQLIEIMESFGSWSGGTNEDNRIEGGYESVPTRDIHFKQVGLHELWLTFLRDYVQPIQLKEYIGYEHDPPRTDLAFVVRYNPSEQPSLRPHHDASTYTLNIALNKPGIDYEGGGCRFVRYNCSVIDSRPGWALIHPGRLTHYHEGLPVTKGTRYILVTFVDP